MQPDEWMAQFQERLSALEQENTRLRTELQDCQRSLASQARVAELERANALLQAELAEEAQQAAIAREQEKAATERAEELVKANDALRRAARNLAPGPSLDNILPLFLREAIAVSGAAAGAVLRRVGDSEFEFVAIWQDDELIRDERLKVHPFYDAVKRVSRSDPAGYFTRLAAGEMLWRLTDDDQAGPLPESGEYHRPYMQRAVWDIPYMIGDRVAGYLSFAFHSDEGPSQVVTETVATLATQVGLALELTQLAEEAKQAAIAREQEKAASERAAELAKANDALKRTISKLAEEPQLDAFLCNVMTAAAEQVGACSSALFVYDENTHTLSMKAFVNDGQPVDIATDSRMEIWRVPVPADIRPGWDLMCREGGLVIHEMDESDPNAWPHSVAWHRMMGHVLVLCLPLVVSGRPVGFIGFDFKQRADVADEKVELARALSLQATLGLELTRLADQARQSAVSAAIAREQEKAASERARQLAKANNALKRNLDSLATQPELEAFLQSVVNEAAAQTRAASAHLFLYDEHTDSLSLSVASDNGGDWRSLADMELWKRPFPADSTPAWETLTSSRTPFVVSLSQANPLFWDGTWAWHRQRGHTRTVAATLWLGEKPLGFLGLAFTAGVAFTLEELELIQALAQQATLAIELTSLAEQSRHTAILEERNRIAQEIHDTLAQAFTGISIHLGIAHRYAKSQSESVCSLIEQATELAHLGLTEARRSVWAMQPDADEYRNLVPSLSRVLQQMTDKTAIGAEMRIVGTPYPLPPDVGLNLLRIGQEALTNALKSAFAQSLIVELQFTPESVCLRVQDDGCGFDLTRHTDSGGFGLLGMQQRCERLGGQLTLTSQPGQGTEILALVPLVPGAATKVKSPEIPMSQTSAIRVLVVDDHPVVRRGLVTLLNLEPGVTMVAEASDGLEAVAQFRIHQPDVTLMDLRLPRMNGVEAIATIRQEFASARIVILTTYDGDEDIYRGLRAGASGYLLKDASCDEILDAIRTVHQG